MNDFISKNLLNALFALSVAVIIWAGSTLTMVITDVATMQENLTRIKEDIREIKYDIRQIKKDNNLISIHEIGGVSSTAKGDNDVTPPDTVIIAHTN